MAQKKTNPKNPYVQLLNEVCVGMGYCGCIKDGQVSHVDDFIPKDGPVSAKQFAQWVVLAENMDPNANAHLKDIARAFVRHMGATEVDAKQLRR